MDKKENPLADYKIISEALTDLIGKVKSEDIKISLLQQLLQVQFLEKVFEDVELCEENSIVREIMSMETNS